VEPSLPDKNPIRCSLATRKSQKFFGTSAITNLETRDALLLPRTPTYTTNTHIETRLAPSQLNVFRARSMFSERATAECFSSVVHSLGLSTTFGSWAISSFSEIIQESSSAKPMSDTTHMQSCVLTWSLTRMVKPKKLVVCQTDDWRQTIRNLWNTHSFTHFGLTSP